MSRCSSPFERTNIKIRRIITGSFLCEYWKQKIWNKYGSSHFSLQYYYFGADGRAEQVYITMKAFLDICSFEIHFNKGSACLHIDAYALVQIQIECRSGEAAGSGCASVHRRGLLRDVIFILAGVQKKKKNPKKLVWNLVCFDDRSQILFIFVLLTQKKKSIRPVKAANTWNEIEIEIEIPLSPSIRFGTAAFQWHLDTTVPAKLNTADHEDTVAGFMGFFSSGKKRKQQSQTEWFRNPVVPNQRVVSFVVSVQK